MSFQYTDSALPPNNLPPNDLPPSEGDRTPPYELLRLTATGSPWAIQNYINSLHKFNYAEPNDWRKHTLMHSQACCRR